MRKSLQLVLWTAVLVLAAPFTHGGMARAQQPGGAAGDEAAVRQAGKDYLSAVEKGDAKAIAEFWTAEGTYTDENGRTVKARQMIEKSITGDDRARPEVKISETRVRFITPDVALEEGGCETTLEGAEAPIAGRFAALWVRKNGQWKLERLQETRTIAAPAAATDPLGCLEPFVGQWSGELGKISIRASVKWNPAKTFLLRELTFTADGKEILNSMAVVGWDPISRQIKSWQFNGDGSFGEGLWDLQGNSWMVVSEGVRPDGQLMSATQLFKFADKNTLEWKTLSGTVAGMPIANFEARLTRKSGGK